MEFKPGFDAGTNNTYNETNFGPYSQNLPNVTELTIINNGTSEDKAQTVPTGEAAKKSLYDRMGEPDPNKDLTVAKTAILNYMSCIANQLKPEKMQSWERFWTGLLDLAIIEKEICDLTKQQGTTFNRKFICSIVHHLSRRDFFAKTYNASAMARDLEGDDQHSIRTHGLNLFPNDEVCKAIDNYIEDFEL